MSTEIGLLVTGPDSRWKPALSKASKSCWLGVYTEGNEVRELQREPFEL